jgi:hypothetical protein
MLVCDGAKRWRRHGRGTRAESQSRVIVPSLATTVIGPLSVTGNSMPSGPPPSPSVKCRHIMASCNIKWKTGPGQSAGDFLTSYGKDLGSKSSADLDALLAEC